MKENRSDAVFAIGGGSVLDAAKLIALAANNPGDLAFFDGIQKAKKPGLPLFALPTTAGTGSPRGSTCLLPGLQHKPHGGVLVQGSRLLSQLRGMSYGRKCRLAG